jgi:signal transduction histidine kinase
MPALGAVVVAIVVTAAVVLQDLRLASARGAGQVALDSAAATIGLCVAFLLYGRFRLSGLARDLLLCLALLMLAGGNAVLSVLPVVLGGQVGRLTTSGIVTGLVGGVLFAASVWAPRWRVDSRRARLLLVLPVLVVAALWWLGPAGERPGTGSADSFGGTQDPLVSAAQALAALAFVVAAVGWSRPRVDDRMAVPLAVAAVFGACSRIDFAIADENSTAWLTAGTVLRVLFYGALIAAAVLEVRDYWRSVSLSAVLEERRRLARELHDGLAQELAFIVTQARGLREQSTNRRAQLVVSAAERALDESRRAIAALTRPLDEPLEVALGQTVEEVAGRFDTRVRLELAGGVKVSPPTREALLRIAREAVSNAGRHGQASTVVVSLENGDGVTLRVMDDGIGLPDTGPGAGHFGLLTMRERAEALGGTFDVRPSRPSGTTVEVHLP